MNGDGPCEKSLNAASPISLATKFATYPHFWSETQKASIQNGGDSAQIWFAGVVKDTFYDKSLTCVGKFSSQGQPASAVAPLAPIAIDPNAPTFIPAPSANPAGLPDLPKELNK